MQIQVLFMKFYSTYCIFGLWALGYKCLNPLQDNRFLAFSGSLLDNVQNPMPNSDHQ